VGKQQTARLNVLLGGVVILIIGFGLSLVIPSMNEIDIGNLIFLGMIGMALSLMIWSFRTMSKKDKSRGTRLVSNTKYYAVFIVVLFTLPLITLTISDFGVREKYQIAEDFDVNLNNFITTFGIVILLSVILVYDKYFKKNREGKGSIRRGWTENEKQEVRDVQGGVCNKCGNHPPRWEYHHKNGNRSDNSLSNCEALCPNCHSVKTHDH